jgi:CrcB protein
MLMARARQERESPELQKYELRRIRTERLDWWARYQMRGPKASKLVHLAHVWFRGREMNPTSTLFASGLANVSPGVLVAGGGALGAWLRYMTSRAFTMAMGPGAAAFPWATLTANVLGSAAMGLLAGWLARHGGAGEPWRLLLGVGVLGGFTTFSSFALEFAVFAQRDQLGLAALYVAASLAAGFAALFAGLWLARVAA